MSFSLSLPLQLLPPLLLLVMSELLSETSYGKTWPKLSLARRYIDKRLTILLSLRVVRRETLCAGFVRCEANNEERLEDDYD